MRTYFRVDIREQQLEALIQQNPGYIEKGLRYVAHQKQAASGRLDVLMVDSGGSLVVAELKVVQDDEMLWQALDYYDYVTSNIEGYAKLYATNGVDSAQEVRLMLIAPDFSQKMVNRCKWLSVEPALFTFTCLKFDGEEDIIPVFTRREIPTPLEPPAVHTVEEVLAYITDAAVRNDAAALLNEVKSWKPANILIDPIKDYVSLKVNGRVFAYMSARRQYYVIDTYDSLNEWKTFAVKNADDVSAVKALMKDAMEVRAKMTSTGLAVGSGN